MKRIFIIGTLIALLAAGFASCNEDHDYSEDTRLSKQLPGTWNLHEDQKDQQGDILASRDVQFVFGASNFSVNYYRKTISKLVSYSVNGTWEIRREKLVLRYNLDSLTTMGMTNEEIHKVLDTFKDNNILVDELKDTNQVFGMPIEISRSGVSAGMMKLAQSPDFGGTYTLFTGLEEN